MRRRPGGEPPPEGVVRAVRAARAKHASDVKVLDLRGTADFTDYFVLLTGNTSRQVQAIVEAIVEGLASVGVKARHIEGMPQGEWVLLDLPDFVVHVFTPAKRDFYDLERLWHDAREVDIPEAAA